MRTTKQILDETNLNDIDAVNVELWEDNQETIIYYNTLHFLNNFTETTKLSDSLDDALNEMVNNSDEFSIRVVKDYLDQFKIDRHAFNTYNSDTILSDGLQYATFNLDGIEDAIQDDYLIVQYHYGLDSRAGYTDPSIFHILDYEYFILAMHDVYANCECSQGWSDDGGWNWYDIDFTIKYDEDEDETKAICNNCDEPVAFHVMEQF